MIWRPVISHSVRLPSPQARKASPTSCVVPESSPALRAWPTASPPDVAAGELTQYMTMSGSSCLPHATIPPCTCNASENPAFFTMASTSAERTPVLQ